jgi:hypothetical protein
MFYIRNEKESIILPSPSQGEGLGVRFLRLSLNKSLIPEQLSRIK